MRKGHLGFFFAAVCALSLLLAACGGGGGGGSSSGGGSTTTTSSISGLVGSGGSGSGSTSLKTATAQGVTNSPIPNAMIEVLAFDKSGNLTDSETSNTLTTGTFAVNLDLANAGGYVVVNVTKSGYATYSKRIDFDSPADLNLSAAINEVVTSIITVQDGIFNVTSASGAERKVVRIALFKDSVTGKRTVVSGSAVALRKAAEGDNPVLQVDIPAQPLLDAGVTTLKADLNSYNPSLPDELSAFPGDFVDSSGNKLVSSGFDYMSITTDSGASLGNVVGAARVSRLLKAADDLEDPCITGTCITRQIPPGVCKNLLRDASCAETDSTTGRCKKVRQDTDAGADGYGVPVYTYNPRKGDWVLLGIGMLDIDGNEIINGADANAVGDIFNTGDGIDHKDYQQFCQDKEDASEYFSMIVVVSNEDFLADWWNLDYPLIFEAPKQICTNVNFKDQGGNPLSGIYVSLWDDDSAQSYSYAWGSSDSTGKVSLKAALMDNSDTDRSGTLGYWDPINYIYNTVAATLGDSPACTTTAITITKPDKCVVTGVVKDEGGAAKANQYVYIHSADPVNYFYNYAYTSASGAYTMDAKCGVRQDIYAGWDTVRKGRFIPNGLINGTEITDAAGTDPVKWQVTMAPIIIENNPPYAYGWLSTTSVFEGAPTTAYIYGWDNECDKPLTWRIFDGGSIVNSGTWNDCSGYKEQSLLLSGAGNHPLIANVTDSKGKTGTYSLGTVNVAATANRMPIIRYAYASASTVDKGGTITLYGSAYDPDGNSLVWGWQSDVNGAICDGTTGASVNSVCQYIAPLSDGPVTLTFYVDDAVSGMVTRSFDIYVGDLPSEIGIIIQ